MICAVFNRPSTLLVGLFLSMQACAVTSVAAATPANEARPSLPSLSDPGRAWAEFLRTATYADSSKANSAVQPMYDEKGNPSANCKEGYARLDAAIAIVPVSVALWYAGYECAQATGDSALAARYGDGVAKLAAHALSQESDAPWGTPIMVLSINDKNALIDATGMPVRYSFIDHSQLPEHYATYVALWDAKAKSERHLSFDFLDSLSQLKSDEPAWGYPSRKASLRRAFLKQQQSSKYETALDLVASSDAANAATGPEKLAFLRGPAANGGLNSLRSWLHLCVEQPFKGCEDGLVDALLPPAEKNLAMYKLQLALAYGNGVGVPKDLKAAMLLVDAVATEWGGGNAITYYATQMLSLDEAPLPSEVASRLALAAEQGNYRAARIRMLDLVRRAKSDDLPPATLSVVLDLATRGDATARSIAAAYYSSQKNVALEMRWRLQAAEAGDEENMYLHGLALIDGENVAKNEAEGLAWMRKSAMAGDADAMRYMGWYAEIHRKWIEAERWFASAAAYDDLEGTINLAALYAKQHPGLSGDAKRAVEIFDWLETVVDKPDVRQAFAWTLLETASIRDPERAEKLLRKDADRGDHQSEFQLGLAHLDGKLKTSNADEGQKWIDKALVGDKGPLTSAFASWLYSTKATPEARKRALELHRSMVALDFVPAMNELAWIRCTSDDPALRSPTEGLAVAERMGSPEKLEGSFVDTLAACHAATGNFDKAVQLQKLAISMFLTYPTDVEDADKIQARLEQYSRKEHYIEPSKAKAPGS